MRAGRSSLRAVWFRLIPKQGRARRDRFNRQRPDMEQDDSWVEPRSSRTWPEGFRRRNGTPSTRPGDGANGIVDPRTGTMYISAGAYFAATDDKGKTFQTVYQPNIPGWAREGSATGTAAFGTLAVALRVSAAPNAKCPCLVLVTSPGQREDVYSPFGRSGERVRIQQVQHGIQFQQRPQPTADISRLRPTPRITSPLRFSIRKTMQQPGRSRSPSQSHPIFR